MGSQDFRDVVTCRNGDALATTGYAHTVDLVDPDEGAFLMTVVMPVARLNKPPSGASAD